MRSLRLFVAAILSLVDPISTTVIGAPQEPVVLNDNGGWCWFQDERVIVVGDLLVTGSVATKRGTGGDRRAGNIEVAAYDLKTNAPHGVAVLNERLESDDHNVPAFLVRPDGRLLAVYARHGTDHLVRFRISTRPGDPLEWEPERQLDRKTSVTYSNLFRLAAENHGKGRIYNFYRGEGWNPNFVISDDDGKTWTYGGRLVKFSGRPYLKYASNGRDEVHFVTTEHHPRNYDNSIYHGFVRRGVVHASDGTPIKNLSEGPIVPSDATRVFAGDRDRVAWPIDLHLDAEGRPRIGYSVQMNEDPRDLRYRFARWDGSRWNDHAMGRAGSALYLRESDYSGLIALHPDDPATVFIAADVHPVTGDPLVSKADGRRHYEIFRGRSPDRGASWRWSPITKDSTADNIRPIVPRWKPERTILLWLRGEYLTYTDYDLDVVVLVDPKPLAIEGGER